MDTNCLKTSIQTYGRTLTPEEQTTCFDTLTASCSNSAQVKHLNGWKQLPLSPSDNLVISPGLTAIIQNSNSLFLKKLNLEMPGNIKLCCQKMYKHLFEHCDVTKIAIQCIQGSDNWKFERQFRITGSRCYFIYTYKGKDWVEKSTDYFYPKAFTNKYVKHGIMFEKVALAIYKQRTNNQVFELGLFVCDCYPWLAYSTDGVIFQQGKPTKLLEIKCPFSGKDEPAINFVHSYNYLQVSQERGVRLKKCHAYYGQVQLGMALLNLPECELIIYSSQRKSFLNIIVPFDEEFAADLIERISYNYYQFMIHPICAKKKNREDF